MTLPSSPTKIETVATIPGPTPTSGSRRRFLHQAGALAAGATFMPAVLAQAKSIVVTCWGGDYEKAIKSCFADPYAKETGIGVSLVNNADLTKMKVQVDSKNVQWDVFDSVGPQITAGARQGLWEDIDAKIVDRSDLVSPGGKDYVGTYLFGGGVAYDPKRVPEGKRPQNLKDFWDVQRFPGRRGLRTRISETLEMALVADGVAPDKLYPLDVERGFKALDRIKPSVKKWIETTPETITLITSNELDYTYSYMSRVFPAQKAGSSVAMATGQTINSLEYLAVPKYGKNTEAAMRYVAFCLRPDRQAAFANTVFFAPNARKAVPLVAAESQQYMPDVLNPAHIIMNDGWWADKYDALQKRFTEWMLT
jgi:putative spermidine/putrescine transport system substrate-binding protein